MGLMDLLTQQQNKCGTGYIWNGKTCVSEERLKVPISNPPITSHSALSEAHITHKTTYPNNSIAIGGKLITNPFWKNGTPDKIITDWGTPVPLASDNSYIDLPGATANTDFTSTPETNNSWLLPSDLVKSIIDTTTNHKNTIWLRSTAGDNNYINVSPLSADIKVNPDKYKDYPNIEISGWNRTDSLHIYAKEFKVGNKKIVKVDYNGHTLKFGPQLLDTWVPADGPIKNFKVGALDAATMQAPSMGQHNGWPNRWDANRVINGGTSKGFMNIGTSGVLPTDFKYTFLSGGYGVNNIFYRITFIEGDDIVRNGDMTKPWEATYSGHTTKTTWDFRSNFPFSYEYRTHEDGPWISTNPNQQYQIAKTYNNIPWGFIATSGLDPTIKMLKFAGGTSAGSLFAIDKVEMYRDPSAATK